MRGAGENRRADRRLLEKAPAPIKRAERRGGEISASGAAAVWRIVARAPWPARAARYIGRAA